jgi:hypothetical protein
VAVLLVFMFITGVVAAFAVLGLVARPALLLTRRNEDDERARSVRGKLDELRKREASLRSQRHESDSPEVLLARATQTERQAMAQAAGLRTFAADKFLERILWASTTLFAKLYRLGNRGPVRDTYHQAVCRLAKEDPARSSTLEAELVFVQRAFETLVDSCSDDELEQLLDSIPGVAASERRSYKALLAAGGAASLAQASGFGVYLMASSVVGSISSALGVTLPFVFYTSMSKGISLMIGPPGWTVLGLWGVAKLAGSDNARAVAGISQVVFLRQRLIRDRDRELADIQNEIRTLEGESKHE